MVKTVKFKTLESPRPKDNLPKGAEKKSVIIRDIHIITKGSRIVTITEGKEPVKLGRSRANPDWGIASPEIEGAFEDYRTSTEEMPHTEKAAETPDSESTIEDLKIVIDPNLKSNNLSVALSLLFGDCLDDE